METRLVGRGGELGSFNALLSRLKSQANIVSGLKFGGCQDAGGGAGLAASPQPHPGFPLMPQQASTIQHLRDRKSGEKRK